MVNEYGSDWKSSLNPAENVESIDADQNCEVRQR